jgi:aconitate hydratase
MFNRCYAEVAKGNDNWNNIVVPDSECYQWSSESTYIKCPPYFDGMDLEPVPVKNIKGAYCLLNLGDFITTDHISPAGAIAVTSPAAKFLNERNI